MKNQFEQHLKQSLSNFEAEYNPADWADLQNRLGKTNIGKSNSMGKGLMIAASIAVVGGFISFFTITNTENKPTPAANSVNPKQVIIERENAIQPKEIPSEKIENSNSRLVVNASKKKQPVVEVDTKKNILANNRTENQTNNTEKADRHNEGNTAENGAVTKEQPKEPVVSDVISNQPTAIPFSASFHSEINKVCEGESIQFTADNNDVSCIYKWTFGDGGYSSEQNPSHVFAEAGVYNVKLHVVSTKDRKQADQKNTITVAPAPSVQMSYVVSDDNSLLVNFEADADRITEWKWSFGDKQTASVQNPSHTYGKRGNYKVEVTATNAAGCSNVMSKDVNLKNNLNLLAPNAFTPDGNGINDTWMPVALLNGDYTFTLTVFDKAGNIVFRTSDKNHPWDGQNTKVGDTFIWRAIVKDKNGEETSCQGLITISE